MELNVFKNELESALTSRGFSEEVAREQVAKITRKFTPQDLAEIEAIQSTAEIDQLADGIASILNKRAAQNAQQNQPAAQPQQPAQQTQKPVQQQRPRPAESQRLARETYEQPKPVYREEEPVETPARTVDKKAERKRQMEEDDYFTYSSEAEPTTKGMLIFWLGLFITLPITLGILAVIFGAFAAVFVALAALIVVGIAILVAIVAVGAVISLVAIVFGITQLFSFVAGGIYEIGLGIMVAGIVLFTAILLYNFSLRFLPWLIRQLGTFAAFVARKLKDLFLYVRRECYKL